MNKWINRFLKKENLNKPDKTDRFKMDANMSGLSVPSQGLFPKNLGNMPETRPDKTDRFEINANLSGLSVPSQGLFPENLDNSPNTGTDITDKCLFPSGLSVLSVSSEGHFRETSLDELRREAVFDDFEERLAIAEYDGHQTPSQAQRIAYLDAFMAVLSTLPQEEVSQENQRENWLDYKINDAREWLKNQGMQEPG